MPPDASLTGPTDAPLAGAVVVPPRVIVADPSAFDTPPTVRPLLSTFVIAAAEFNWRIAIPTFAAEPTRENERTAALQPRRGQI